MTFGFRTALSSVDRGYRSLRESLSPSVQWACIGTNLGLGVAAARRNCVHDDKGAIGLFPRRGRVWCVRNIDLVVESGRDVVAQIFGIKSSTKPIQDAKHIEHVLTRHHSPTEYSEPQLNYKKSLLLGPIHFLCLQWIHTPKSSSSCLSRCSDFDLHLASNSSASQTLEPEPALHISDVIASCLPKSHLSS